MSSKGGFDVSNIALNMKRKLAAEGGEGVDMDADKRPKLSGYGDDVELIDANELPDDLDGLLDEADNLPAEGDLDAILKLVEEAPEVKALDAAGLRALVLRFERAVNTNVQMRSKFAGNAEKFMDSEIALDEAITSLTPVSAAPNLYGELVDLNIIASLLSLVNHENGDIGIAVVSLLHDLLDSDELTGADEEIASQLVDSLMENNGPQVLVANLFRLEEKNNEDFQAVHNTLSIFEALGEVKSELVVKLALEPKMLKFLCQRIAKEGFDQNKLYASEMLSIFMQAADLEVKTLIGEGQSPYLISILKVIAKFRRRDPKGNEETEFLENLYNCVGFSLHQHTENQLRFAKAEGLELMIAILRKKKYAKHGAIKTIDFALQKCQGNCELFVDQGGLKVLFAIFMKRSKKKDRAFEKTTEEHVVSILQQLFLNLSDVRYFRLLRKFQESDMQKVERLVELQDKYARELETAEKKYRKAHPLHMRKRKPAEDDMDDEALLEAEDEYLRRAEAGLFTLQGVDLLLGFVATAGQSALKTRVVQLLNQQDDDLTSIKKILDEYAEHIDDDEASDNKLKTAVQAISSMLVAE